MSATVDAGERSTAPPESVYVAADVASGETITSSLRALLPTRHHPIARHHYTVLDTFDGRVRRAGAYLTRGGENGISSVAWQSHGGRRDLAIQLKHPVSFAWDFPAGPLQDRLTSVIGPRRLLAQADAEEYGSLLEILDNRGKTVARLRITSGRVKPSTSAAAWRPMPTLITLTGLHGYEDTYKRLQPVIESRPGLQPCPEGPFGIMLARLGLLTRADGSLPRLDLAATVRADLGARQIHQALLDILDTNEPGLRADLDTEFLHDFRVAVRRTRSLLGQIRHVFPQDAVEHFSAEFSWLGRLTGPPRDMDVLVLTLRGRRSELSADDHEALMVALEQARQHEHLELLQALDSDRYRKLLSDWKSFLERPLTPTPEPANASASLASVVSQRAWRLSRRIANSSDEIDGQTPAERLHAVRIAAKKLRYLIDVTPTFYDSAALTLVLNALKKVQRVLGDFNDADVQQRRLLDCGRALGAVAPASVLMTLGQLSEQCRARRERLRPEVVEKLRAFRSRDTRSACRRAFKKIGREKRTR